MNVSDELLSCKNLLKKLKKKPELFAAQGEQRQVRDGHDNGSLEPWTQGWDKGALQAVDGDGGGTAPSAG